MKSGFYVILILIIGFSSSSFAQSFHLDFLFSPGAIAGTEYLAPSAINDSTDFQLTQYKLRYIMPLKTKFGVDLKDFNFKEIDAKASQIFLDGHFNVLKPTVSDNNSFDDIYNAGVGFTAVTASVRNGIWLYSGNFYVAENSNTFTENLTPNFRAYVANLKIKDLSTYYFYGAGLLLNQGKLLPFPVLGCKLKLMKNMKGEVVIPLHVKLNFKINKKLDIDVVNQFSGVNAVYREGSGLSGNDNSLNFSQMKAFVAFNVKAGKHYRLKLEGGYSYLQQISSWDNGEKQKIDSAPYLGATFNYHFGKSVFKNFLNKE